MAEALAPALLGGCDWLETADIIGGETGDHRVLPILPERGIIADAVARTLCWMEGLEADRGPRSWRLCARPQRLSWAARDLWERDLDTLEEPWGRTGGAMTVPILGPWTLAASVERADGHRAVIDPGLLRDLPGIYAHAFLTIAQTLTRRFDARCSILLLEPELSALQAGAVPGTSEFDTIPPLPAARLKEYLHGVIAPVAETDGGPEVILSFGTRPIVWEVAAGSGAQRVDLTATALTTSRDLDGLGSLLSQGTRLSIALEEAGCAEYQASARNLARLWATVGYDPALLSGDVRLRGVDGTHVSVASGLKDQLRGLVACAEILTRDAGNLLA